VARIRKIEIRNFRSIQVLNWIPSEGINCLIGPGDSGKTTILDAIDLCLGARRNISFGDTDFFNLDVTRPIGITLTLGALPDQLKNLESYGDFLCAFDATTGSVEEEPRHGFETVLVLNLTVSGDLEPTWSLVSRRAQQQGIERSINWKDRISISPARLGNYTHSHLSWTRGSVLNRLSDERANLGPELARAAREARANFGNQADAQFTDALQTVTNTAASLGIPIGGNAKALLDAHSVSIGDGAITLHSENGIPLRSLGTGSTKLLVAGLQRAAANSASIILVDELEHGLEPHRLIRLLGSLGAKETTSPLQVFMTTHSPVAVRELNGKQVFVVRTIAEGHQVLRVGTEDDVQSTIRLDPEAFLARTVIVCEGASEVGFVRGLDEYYVTQGHPSLWAKGIAYVNVGGGNPDKCYARGNALLSLGYRVMVLVDNDKPATQEIINRYVGAGGHHITWRENRALEDELFLSMDDKSVQSLLQYAIELVGEELVNNHILSKSTGEATLESVFAEANLVGFTNEARTLLGKASRVGKNGNSGWFKSVGKFEGVARDIVGPNLQNADPAFQALVMDLLGWAHAT